MQNPGRRIPVTVDLNSPGVSNAHRIFKGDDTLMVYPPLVEKCEICGTPNEWIIYPGYNESDDNPVAKCWGCPKCNTDDDGFFKQTAS